MRSTVHWSFIAEVGEPAMNFILTRPRSPGAKDAKPAMLDHRPVLQGLAGATSPLGRRSSSKIHYSHRQGPSLGIRTRALRPPPTGLLRQSRLIV
jgi:hypothetical protein